MGKELNVVKVPRSDAIIDRPASFSHLQNLHLDLMEVKKKLKKDAPLVFIQQKPPKPIVHPPPQNSEPEEHNTEDMPDEIELETHTGNDEYEETDDAAMLSALAEDGEYDVSTETYSPPAGSSQALTQTHAQTEAQANTQPEEPDPYAGMSPEQKEAHEKQEYIWRFHILKKKYRERDIPVFNEHDDLYTMKTTYDREIKEIGLETNVDSYRTYLITGFTATEYVLTNVAGINFRGFAAAQMQILNQYDSMLIELGEKSQTRWGSTLPVEIRLIGFMLFQAGIFYLGKILSERGGTNINAIFDALSGRGAAPPSGKQQVEEPIQVKKMRGPSMKVSDVKKKQEEEDASDDS